MPFLTTYASHSNADPATNAREAMRMIRENLGDVVGTVIFFASVTYDPATVAAEAERLFPRAATFGCTTSGECCDDQMLQHSIAAVALSDDFLTFAGLGLVVKEKTADVPDAFETTEDCLRMLAERAGAKPLELDYQRYIGFGLFNETNPFTEEIIIKLGEMTNVNFIGGVAGDDLRFDIQYVFYRGKIFRDAGVVALWEPKNGFAILKTQAVEPGDKSFLVTKGDEETSTVWELDNRPAATAYAEALGLKTEELTPAVFEKYLLALMIDGEPFPKLINQLLDGGGMKLIPSLRNSTRLTVCKTTNIIETTGAALDVLRAERGSISGLIHINCVGRHTRLVTSNQEKEFGRLFHGLRQAGFSSYGEVYIGIVGLTSTMIVFK